MKATFHVSRFKHYVSLITFLVALVATVCVALFAISAPVSADVAPPEQPPGSNISPEGQTQVVMSTERIVIEVQPSGDSALGKVTGDFTMHNSGNAGEQMKVRFPIANPSGESTGYGLFPTVENFAAQVGGSVVTTSVITTPNPLLNRGETEPVKWAAFDVAFPAGQDTKITVKYDIKATGYSPSARFAYVLETGAGWKDAIGSADIVLRLPYAASNENVFYNLTTRGSQFAGNEVRWHWNQLEPNAQDNLAVTILVPKVWEAILEARKIVDAKPDDAQALAYLARAYNAAITSKYPLEEHDPYATKSEETFSRAVAANPGSAALHVQYASAIWQHMMVQASAAEEDPNVKRIVAEISSALALDPQNAEAKALLNEVQLGVQGTVVLPTAIPFASHTASSATVQATVPTAMPTPLIEVSPGVAPTTTIPLPLATKTVGPLPTAVPAALPSNGTNNLLLVVGIVGLPMIAAATTFLIISQKKKVSDRG